MRQALAALLLFAAPGIAGPAEAHDFWIDLQSYRVKAGAPTNLRLLIGDTAIEPWETLWPKVVSLRDYGPAGVTDLQAGLRPKTASDEGGATISLVGEGTHVVAFESAIATSDLSAEEFNDYAQHEGLSVALAARKAAGTEGSRGRETYSRRAKALVQIGGRATANVTKPIGQTLEITPLTNPLAVPAGAPLVLRVDWHGKPLPFAKVVLSSMDDRTIRQPAITDDEGLARFPAPTSGRWRANVIWTQPTTHPNAEWDTVFCSLTFGF